MKTIAYIFLLFPLIFCSCEGSISKVYPVQGKWKIEQMSYQFAGQKDSIVQNDLGYIIFDECSQKDNEAFQCMGTRLYADGQKATFYYGTYTGAIENKTVPRLDIARTSSGNDQRVTDELRSLLIANKLTDAELILSCIRCEVGNDKGNRLHERFELRAVKVKDET